jgi:hypothetical protein
MLPATSNYVLMGSSYQQCSGSGSTWIRIRFALWIQIHMKNPDPDPAACEFIPQIPCKILRIFCSCQSFLSGTVKKISNKIWLFHF